MASAVKEASLDGLEFDGNTVLCRVCGDKASGFHYGVHACEGCKGFFRRSIQQKIQYRPCLKNQQCNIMRVNRNRCQYCRLKKCISVGMSRDAVRFGRVPKREKAKIMEQMQKVNAVSQIQSLNSVIESEKDFLQKIIETHVRTCQFTRNKFAAFFDKAWQNPRFVNCPPHMACPLNPSPECTDGIQKWEEFSDCFTPAIRNVVNFAKCIPGFHVFSQEDQVTLLKAGTFEVLLVHLACLFDAKTNTMLFANGQLYKRVSMTVTNSAGFLLDSMFDYAERFNELQLTDEEMALFSALVIIASDRPGLRYVEQVERVQSIISQGLQRLMKTNHPDDASAFTKLLMKIPDLRTLNTLHSEKLLGLTLPNGADPGEHGEGRPGEGRDRAEPAAIAQGARFGAGFPPGFSGQNHEPKPEFAVPKSAPPQVMTSSPHVTSPHHVTPPVKVEGTPIVPHHVKAAKTQEEVILQTPFGTFHRFPQPHGPHPPHPPGGLHPRARDPRDGREEDPHSPEPLEMDMAPHGNHVMGNHGNHGGEMPKLSPAVSPQKEGHKMMPQGGGLGELYRRAEHMDVSEYKGPKPWDYDMRSTRSNSMSSNSSLESQDSAYRTISNPSTPRSATAGPITAGPNPGTGEPYPRHLPPGGKMYPTSRLALIPERDDVSSKGSSRCSSPNDLRHHGNHYRHPGNHSNHEEGDAGRKGFAHDQREEKRVKVSSPHNHVDGDVTDYRGRGCPIRHHSNPSVSSPSNGSGAPSNAAMRHPELLSRLQSVPAGGGGYLPRAPAPSSPTHGPDPPHGTPGTAPPGLKEKEGEGWEDLMVPHPAYLPLPYPPAPMHPAIVYRYNQLAMHQLHALQQLHAQHTAHVQGNHGNHPDIGHSPDPRDESGARDAQSPPPNPAPVHIKCEPT